MSSKAQHFRAGTLLSIATGAVTYLITQDLASTLAIAAGSIFGSSLPDQLEISWHTGGSKKRGWFASGYNEGVRHSLIPHRTITHWMVAWFAIMGMAMINEINDPGALSAGLLGLALSGWLHVFMDSRTPMGVPLLHPWLRTRGVK